MKKYLIILILMAHFTGCSTTKEENPAKFLNILVNDQVFRSEIADNNELRQRGLMFREKLKDTEGMFFVFETEGVHSFWMKNTIIPLDIVWISADKKVVDIQTMQPCAKDPCPSYIPDIKAKYVLEVSAGKFHGILGDSVSF